MLAEYNGNGQITARYIHGDRVDEPWIQFAGSSTSLANTRFLHADHQGSIIAYSDTYGNIKGTNSYDAYGIAKSTNAGRFGYTGQLYNQNLDLNYYKARFYHPKLGRFLQTDPVFYEDQMNIYAYVGNDPVNYVDPTGMASDCWLCKSYGAESLAQNGRPIRQTAEGKLESQRSTWAQFSESSGYVPFPVVQAISWGKAFIDLMSDDSDGSAAVSIAAATASGIVVNDMSSQSRVINSLKNE